jgi:hypothetical protein
MDGPADSLFALESMRQALLLLSATAPFRLQTLATEGSELQAKEANRCPRQDRYKLCFHIQSIHP